MCSLHFEDTVYRKRRRKKKRGGGGFKERTLLEPFAVPTILTSTDTIPVASRQAPRIPPSSRMMKRKRSVPQVTKAIGEGGSSSSSSCSICGSLNSFHLKGVHDEEALQDLVVGSITMDRNGTERDCPFCTLPHVDCDLNVALCALCLSSTRQVVRLRDEVKGIVSRFQQSLLQKQQRSTDKHESVKTTSPVPWDPMPLRRAEAEDMDLVVTKEEEEEQAVDPLSFGWETWEITPNLSSSSPLNPSSSTTSTLGLGEGEPEEWKQDTVDIDPCLLATHEEEVKEDNLPTKKARNRRKQVSDLVFRRNIKGTNKRAKGRVNKPTHLQDKEGIESSKAKNDPQKSRLKTCPICKDRFFSETVFLAHVHTDPKNPSSVSYQCQDCPRLLTSRTSLTHHISVAHPRGEPHVCEGCGGSFLTFDKLRYHKSWKCKSKGDEGICSTCGLLLPSTRERMDHERVVHKGLTSTRCYFCGHFCRGTDEVQGHMWTHTMEKPFKCSKCGKEFRKKETLRNHLVLVCGEDEEARVRLRKSRTDSNRKYRGQKKYVCHICGQRFGLNAYLKRHMEVKHPNNENE